VPFPTTQVNLQLPACFSHYPFNAERQAGKLWIPIFKFLVLTRLWIEPLPVTVLLRYAEN